VLVTLLVREWWARRQSEVTAQAIAAPPLEPAAATVSAAATPAPEIRFAARFDPGEVTIEFSGSSDPEETTKEYSSAQHE
jgi:hypothetical protein